MFASRSRSLVPLALLVTLSQFHASAAEPALRLKAHLDAGEFGPALAIAQQVNDAVQRDAMLGQVAVAQAASGMRTSAVTTASLIDSDVSRNQAISSAAATPPGRSGFGGGPQANFGALISLITSTVSPTTWDDVGGPGSIAPFAGGVWIDPQGAMHRLLETDQSERLDRVRDQAPQTMAHGSPRHASPLRKVSLPRLERAVQLRLAAGHHLDEEMKLLAGLQEIQYVLVYPETGDLVVAGPAGDWQRDREGRIVSADNGHPVLQLDDLVVILRHMKRPNATFGCSITPQADSLARTKTFLEESSRTPLQPGQRDAWLTKVKNTLGQQDIECFGISPHTRVAHVLVEADYRMKLVGIGLEDSVPGVRSYLASIPKDKTPPSLGVLRWWFTLKYDAVAANPMRNAFELRGQGVQVLSENEMLTATGQRVHTGDSDELNRQFARSFTEHFSELARKYPIYAELANLFDLALTGALIQSEHLAEQANWHMTCFGDHNQYKVSTSHAPRKTHSVLNHRMMNQKQFVAAISGGVHFDASEVVKPAALQADHTLGTHHAASAPEQLPRDVWWWD